MAIENYEHPQSLAAQQLDVVEESIAADRLALIVGIQFLVAKYVSADDPGVPGVAFDVAGQTLAYASYDADDVSVELDTDDHTVDQESVRVFAKDVELLLAFFDKDEASSGSNARVRLETGTNNLLRIQAGAWSGTGLNSQFDDAPVLVGDIALVDSGIGAPKKRKVTALVGAVVASSFGSNDDATNETLAPTTYNAAATSQDVDVVTAPGIVVGVAISSGTFDGLEVGSRVGANYGERYTLTVTLGGAPGVATMSVVCQSGRFATTAITTSDATGDFRVTSATLGGVVLDIETSGDLVTGQVIVVDVIGAYATPGDDQLTVAGTYEGARDTTYVIQVLESPGDTDSVTGAVVRVYDTAGVDAAAEVTLTNDTAFALGTSGLQATLNYADTTLTQGGLLVGDAFFVNAKAESESTTAFTGIRLDGAAVDLQTLADPYDADLSVTITRPFSGELSDGFTVGAGSVVVAADLSVEVEGRDDPTPLADALGTLHVEFRAARLPYSGEGIITVESATDITTLFGDVVLENDLAFAVSEAFRGSEGRPVLVVRAAADTVDAFSAALAKTETNPNAYSLSVITDNADVRSLLVSHVEEMSQEDVKRMRRGYVGVSSPGRYVALETVDDAPVTATIGSNGSEYVLLTITNAGVDLTTLGLVRGDIVRLLSADEDLAIREVLNATEIELLEDYEAPLSPAQAVVIYHEDTVDSQTLFLNESAAALNTRRVCQVWYEDGTKVTGGSEREIPPKFAGAYIAGLRSALLPQQGMTRQAVSVVTSIPSSYTRYGRRALDEIARHGTFIIAQDQAGGEVYVRHQLTTDVSNGILYYEDSPGVILDVLSLDVDAQAQQWVGKRNVTRELLADIRSTLIDVLIEASNSPSGDTRIGPMITGYEGVFVRIHPTLRDQVEYGATVFLPVPLNRPRAVLRGSIDFALAAE